MEAQAEVLNEEAVRDVVFQRLCSLARSRQEATSRSIVTLGSIAQQQPTEPEGWRAHWKSLGQHCSRLVLEVEALHRWVAWAGRALADLRKGRPLVEVFEAQSAWISDLDVSLWLLDPARRCLELVKSCTQSMVVKGLPRKFGFWVDELRMGVWLLDLRLAGKPLPDLTALRLQFRAGGSEDSEICVKNTFLDTSPSMEERRSRSSSRSPRTASPKTPSPAKRADDGAATPPPPSEEKGSSGRALGDVANAKRCAPLGGTLRKGSKKPASGKETAAPKAHTPAKREVDSAGACGGGGRAATKGGAAPWWKQVSDVCPISSFPISLLPYPPFKLQMSRAEPESATRSLPTGASMRLVDGGFLVVQVLATMRFEALGQELDNFDVQALDQYMKRCRLGHFRLGHARDLINQGGERARMELDSMRDAARRRLASLKQIQRIRVSRHSAI